MTKKVISDSELRERNRGKKGDESVQWKVKVNKTKDDGMKRRKKKKGWKEGAQCNKEPE